jgi:hypothetical protein
MITAAFQRGDDEARIGTVAIMLGLADHAPLVAPAVEGLIAEVAKQARAGPGGAVQQLDPAKLRLQHGFQAGIARQTEHVTDPVGLVTGGVNPHKDAEESSAAVVGCQTRWPNMAGWNALYRRACGPRPGG